MLHPLVPVVRTGETSFTLEVDWPVCVGRGGKGFLFGGSGLAAAVIALEDATGRPTVWATAQFASYARPGSHAEIACKLLTQGKYLTQARATMCVEGGEILSAMAALGSRDGLSDQWTMPRAVPRPEACAELPHWGDDQTIGGVIRFRPASGRFGGSGPEAKGPRSEDGCLLVWVRPADDTMKVDRPVLAVIGDFLSPGIRNATGRNAGGNSLDNTIRYVTLVPTDWVLCEIQIDAISGGIFHGSMKMFAECGTLLAVASQSMILRVRD